MKTLIFTWMWTIPLGYLLMGLWSDSIFDWFCIGTFVSVLGYLITDRLLQKPKE